MRYRVTYTRTTFIPNENDLIEEVDKEVEAPDEQAAIDAAGFDPETCTFARAFELDTK